MARRVRQESDPSINRSYRDHCRRTLTLSPPFLLHAVGYLDNSTGSLYHHSEVKLNSLTPATRKVREKTHCIPGLASAGIGILGYRTNDVT